MAKKVKAKEVKGGNGATQIDVKDLQVGITYETYVKDLVKVLNIDEKNQRVHLRNITGGFEQWTQFKNVNIIGKVR